jgi:recombination protein U
VVVNSGNRGKALEDLVEICNEGYRAKGVAVIHRIPAAWLPIRNREGRIVSAKVDRKATVDFVGHVATSLGRAVPVAFEVKEVSSGDRWPLSKLEDHQYACLRDSYFTGAAAFVLVGYREPRRYFLLPFPELRRRWERWKEGGPASVRCGDSDLIEISFPNYLASLIKEPNRFLPLSVQLNAKETIFP